MSNKIDDKNLRSIVILIALIIIVTLAVVVLIISNKSATNKIKVVTEPTVVQEPVNQIPVKTPAIQNNPVLSLEGSRTEVEGASTVTKDDIVVTPTGQAVLNNADPMTENAPRQTAPITVSDLPSTAIKLNISATGYTPNNFTVKPGEVVTLSVTSIDTQTHVFKFNDPSLSAIAVGVAPQETRAITFNAPTTPGEYSFYCWVPGHSGRGEVGKMIVK